MPAKINPISIALCLAMVPFFGSNVIAHHHPTHGNYRISIAKEADK